MRSETRITKGYQLCRGVNSVSMPVGAKILAVSDCELWVLQPRNSEATEERIFHVYGCGEKVSDLLLDQLDFLGLFADGTVRIEIFEQKSGSPVGQFACVHDRLHCGLDPLRGLVAPGDEEIENLRLAFERFEARARS